MQNQIAVDIEKFKSFIKSLKERIKIALSKKQEAVPTATGAAQASTPIGANKNTRLLIIVGVVFIFAVILLIIASIVKGLRDKGVMAPGKATPVPVTGTIPDTSVSNPSKYATDEGVLKIEAALKKLDSDLNSADLRESNLRLPDLDFDVKFE